MIKAKAKVKVNNTLGLIILLGLKAV